MPARWLEVPQSSEFSFPATTNKMSVRRAAHCERPQRRLPVRLSPSSRSPHSLRVAEMRQWRRARRGRDAVHTHAHGRVVGRGADGMGATAASPNGAHRAHRPAHLTHGSPGVGSGARALRPARSCARRTPHTPLSTVDPHLALHLQTGDGRHGGVTKRRPPRPPTRALHARVARGGIWHPRPPPGLLLRPPNAHLLRPIILQMEGGDRRWMVVRASPAHPHRNGSAARGPRRP